MEKHVFILGSKGIPAKYGGYETFVEYLTKRQQTSTIKYHVACKVNDIKAAKQKHFTHNNADCFNVFVPNIGPAQAIYYDLKALNQAIHYARYYRLSKPIFYILACRIGPFMWDIVRRVHAIGGVVYVNPDGHEWLRAKWSKPVRRYWKHSEQLMVKHADLLICDSKNIESYIQTTYAKYQPKTKFIAYGADIKSSPLADDAPKLVHWFKQFNIKPCNYYLIVGRFVPENNYATMIQEFMDSDSPRDLVIITNVEQNKFYEALKAKTHFDQDKRIKFVGTVYDADLLKKIREQAFAYFHGHAVGGTNPSLLEALANTQLNLLYDVGFNREVAEDSALYWTKQPGNLAQLITRADQLSTEKITELNQKSTQRILMAYSWQRIVAEYEKVFIG
ncbi:beta 1-4 rhamnosyltransferase Cps2T [Loigolactobacillus rennini]|uniref:Rhamnosyltransferase n=2 Tax=Loigolactobacillus rennini TaxID=238013 RepID=A0A0R2CS63_9LACO|nr:glycosyltransferase family 1 protein [Loigolactobacillus rennini]KRM94621.1 rhamnosyltransferase [Loigolactobacillus rennini DSM 20253]SFZ89108.1 Alpha-D-GlcNAc alpha-1,2-L-rhamnosyltransferase [Loigolactobacillus rennini]